MILYLVKWLYFWLLPIGGLVLAFFVLTAYLFWKKARGRWPLLVLTALFYLLSIAPVSDALVHGLENQYAQPALNDVTGDVIVILGGGSIAGVADVDGTGQVSGDAANRLLTALRLQKATNLPILFSGGNVFSGNANEAAIEKRLLLSLGVPEEKIFLENQSRNTAENAVFSKKIIDAQGWQHPLLVTSAFHLPRAVYLFRRAGCDVTPYASDYLTDKSINWSAYTFIPQVFYLNNSCMAVKEYVGLAAARLGLQ